MQSYQFQTNENDILQYLSLAVFDWYFFLEIIGFQSQNAEFQIRIKSWIYEKLVYLHPINNLLTLSL